MRDFSVRVSSKTSIWCRTSFLCVASLWCSRLCSKGSLRGSPGFPAQQIQKRIEAARCSSALLRCAACPCGHAPEYFPFAARFVRVACNAVRAEVSFLLGLRLIGNRFVAFDLGLVQLRDQRRFPSSGVSSDSSVPLFRRRSLGVPAIVPACVALRPVQLLRS